MAWPGPAVKTGCTVTFPRFGKELQFIVKACGGTTAEIALENGLETPVEVCKRMLNVAAVSMARLKFIVRVLLAKLALKPRAQAGTRCWRPN
jgi:hypothetical protein